MHPSAADPFNLHDDRAYAAWRGEKLRNAPASVEDLIVDVDDIAALRPQERAAIAERLRRGNVAVYRCAAPVDREALRALGRQFGLVRLDRNEMADDDGISSIQVGPDAAHREFIPYTDRPIRWHTDGYYNPPARRIHAMILHCVRNAASGGANTLFDHELAYIALRDRDRRHIEALSRPDAMTIPPRSDGSGVARDAQAGPVFEVDARRLFMRYTARTTSIGWRGDAMTQAAVQALESVLAAPEAQRFTLTLLPGMGILSANVLHSRSGFCNDPQHPRLLLRARYHEPITL